MKSHQVGMLFTALASVGLLRNGFGKAEQIPYTLRETIPVLLQPPTSGGLGGAKKEGHEGAVPDPEVTSVVGDPRGGVAAPLEAGIHPGNGGTPPVPAMEGPPPCISQSPESSTTRASPWRRNATAAGRFPVMGPGLEGWKEHGHRNATFPARSFCQPWRRKIWRSALSSTTAESDSS